MKKIVRATDVANMQALANLETNLVLVKMSVVENIDKITQLTIMDDSGKLELFSDEEVSWRQFGYGCGIPNGFVLLKLKRRLPIIPATGVCITFSYSEVASFCASKLFDKSSVVLATNSFPEDEKSVRTSKLKRLMPGDEIVIIRDDRTFLKATVLSCEKEIWSEETGRIPAHHSFVFELRDVSVDNQ